MVSFLALLQTGLQAIGMTQGFALRWYSPRMLLGEDLCYPVVGSLQSREEAREVTVAWSPTR